MNRSKLNTNNRITFPKEIRELLKLNPGDSIFLTPCDDGTVIINKAESLDEEYYQALGKSLQEKIQKEEQLYASARFKR